MASCQTRRLIPSSLTDVLANHLLLLCTVIAMYYREILVITCAQIPAKWCGIFDHIDFTQFKVDRPQTTIQLQRITAAALANYYPQSLLIHCKVHSTVSTPLVILLSCIVAAHTYLRFHSLCEQIVLHDVICACSGML